jgi:hypothetical protein
MRSVVFAPPNVAGGVKSLYAVCRWLDELGISRIQPFGDTLQLADWFDHRCALYDHSYEPDLIVYPEICQPRFDSGAFHLCFALGEHRPVETHADLVVCRSPRIQDWVRRHAPGLPTMVIVPSIDRRPFEKDGRRKQDRICYFTRADKHPETAAALRARYGNRVVEIAGKTEAAVAETLKDYKVMVWRGHDKEGSPRPPKEALVAGCTVIGLEHDLRPALFTDFGLKCRTLQELLDAPAAGLDLPSPSDAERAVVRDGAEERKDWERLVAELPVPTCG